LENDPCQFSEKEIIIKVEYKHSPNLTIIDTPGLILPAPGRKNRVLQVLCLFSSICLHQPFFLTFLGAFDSALKLLQPWQSCDIQSQASAVESLVRAKIQHKETIILCLEDCSDWSNATTRRVVMQVGFLSNICLIPLRLTFA
jgi:hypothetical protein